VPSGYTDVVLICFTKDTRAVNGVCDLSVRINGLTSGYDLGAINNASGFTGVGAGTWYGAQPGASNNFSPNIMHFNDYLNTNTQRSILWRTESMYSSDGNERLLVGRCSTFNAMTSITLIGEQGIKTGSIISLYGIKTE
jgi:hypothetical protein